MVDGPILSLVSLILCYRFRAAESGWPAVCDSTEAAPGSTWDGNVKVLPVPS